MSWLLPLFLSWAGAVLAPAHPAPKPPSWEKLYEAPKRNQWVTAVWLAADGSWRAGAGSLVLIGDARGTRPTELGNLDIAAFGEDSTGAILAVGSHQAIWQEGPTGFKLVHERTGPHRTGRAAHEDVLDGLGYVDPEHPERLIAYGSLHVALWRDPAGIWQPTETDLPAQRGTLGPIATPPPGCHIAGWRWLDRTDGLLDCHEGAAYLYKGNRPTQVARLPKPCQSSLNDVTRSGNDLFVSCGSEGRIWQTKADAKTWSQLTGISGSLRLHARGSCLLAAVGRAVYRRCW